MTRSRRIKLSKTAPTGIKTNVEPLMIPLGEKSLYFFPDRVLIKDSFGFGAINYPHLGIEVDESNFILGETKVPSDARIASYTWKYVNKSGGPDRRFHDNPQLPVIATGDFCISSNTGLNAIIKFSNFDSATGLDRGFNKLISVIDGAKPRSESISRKPAVEQRIYCWMHDQVCGPFSFEEITSFLKQGAIADVTLVCPEGKSEWQSLLEFQEESEGRKRN